VPRRSASDSDVGRAELAPLLAVCSGYFMVILDVTIVNVAGPAIGRDLSASRTDLQWIIDGYTIAFFGFYGMIFAASGYFQQRENLSATVTGLALRPAVAVTIVASALSARLSRRYGHRRLMLVGLTTAAVGLAVWALAGATPSYALLVLAMVACGFGTSFTLTGTTATVMEASPAGYAGTASAALNTARQPGSAAGVAMSGSFVAALGLTSGVSTFMRVGAGGYLLGVLLTILCVPHLPARVTPVE